MTTAYTSVTGCSVDLALRPALVLQTSLPAALLRQMMLQGNIKKLEPLLAALAAVPWIDPGAEDGQRVPFIKTTVLDQVEGMGMHQHYAFVHLCCVNSGISQPCRFEYSVLLDWGCT